MTSSSLSASIFGQPSDASNSKSDIKGNSCSELLVSLFESSSKLPSKRNLIPTRETTTVRKKKVKEDDGVTGFSLESVRKRKTSLGNEGFDQEESHDLANGATSRRKKPRKISSEIDETASNDNGRQEEDNHESRSTSMAAANNDGVETVDEVESRTIFVGNLPLSMTRKKLTAIFSKCGTVESTRIRCVPVKGVKLPPESAGNQKLMRKVCVNKGLIDDSIKKTIQGYVVFADESSVKAALEFNNSIIPMESKDDTETNNTLRMRVDTAKPTIDTARSVFVGNLPYSAQEGLLQEHFLTQLGDESVEGVRIVRDRETMQCKGFGYVLLKTKALVAEALTKLPETIFMKRKLRVKACGKRFKGTGKRLAAVEGSSIKDTTNQTSEGRRVTPITGAGRRILRKIEKEGAPPQNGRKRRRAEKKNTPTKHAISKKAAATVKTNKKVKKLQKRISKGMGKSKH